MTECGLARHGRRRPPKDVHARGTPVADFAVMPLGRAEVGSGPERAGRSPTGAPHAYGNQALLRMQTRGAFPAAPRPSRMGLVQRKCACGGECPHCRGEARAEPALAVGDPHDRLEQEADRIADQVMRMPDAQAATPPTAASPVVQRKCAACEKEDAKLRTKLRSSADAEEASAAPPIVHEVLRSPGRPLDAEVRAFMEPRFGRDFGAVRIHTDDKAAASASAVQALAYTVGTHVVFAQRQYAPATPSGKRLLAHELAHVVQQERPMTVPQRPAAGWPHGASERMPERTGDDVRLGVPPGPAGKTAAAAPGGDHAAGDTVSVLGHPAGDAPLRLRRTVVVTPASDVADVLGYFNVMCPQGFTSDGQRIVSNCDNPSGPSCECLCDVTSDSSRDYLIRVFAPSSGVEGVFLFDGSFDFVPTASQLPGTDVGQNPIVEIPTRGSEIEFGAFGPDGSAFWAPVWRILAHEICGHGRLQTDTETDEVTIPRTGQDKTIGVENAIAQEHGEPARGFLADPRQGASFFNIRGNRSKVRFELKDGTHFEPPAAWETPKPAPGDYPEPDDRNKPA